MTTTYSYFHHFCHSFQTPEPAALSCKQLKITDPEAFKTPAGGENEQNFSLNNTESSLKY